LSDQEKFKLLHEEWMSWFDSEDNGCILRQVQSMLFDTLIYKTILKAREIAPTDDKNKIKLNGTMHWFLDKCFFANQLMIVRRLTDVNSDTRSLRKLLNTLYSKRKLLTRKNCFSVQNGYEYDYSETKKKCDKYVKEEEKDIEIGKVISYYIPEELDWERSENMHQDFDILSQTDASNRKPSDTISSSVFQSLLERLELCQPLRDHVDHFVAHTLRKEKREKLDEEAVRITFGQLWKAQEIISSVTKFVGLYLLSRVEHSLLPIPHHSMLKYIELPLVQKDQKAQLRVVEEEFRKEIHAWSICLNGLKKE
jgi:hypothetical protein